MPQSVLKTKQNGPLAMILLLVISPILFIDLFNFNMSNEDDNDHHPHQLLGTHALRRPVG